MYGNPTFANRRSFWGKLLRLKPLHQGPWCCLGDFNELKESSKKVGLRPAEHQHMSLFRDFIDDAGLMDLELKGCKFTWIRNPRDGFVTKQRIDKAHPDSSACYLGLEGDLSSCHSHYSPYHQFRPCSNCSENLFPLIGVEQIFSMNSFGRMKKTAGRWLPILGTQR